MSNYPPNTDFTGVRAFDQRSDEIQKLEKVIRSHAILLYVLAGLTLLLLVFNLVINPQFLKYIGTANAIQLILFPILHIIAGILINRLNKVGFIIALLVLGIVMVLDVIYIIQFGIEGNVVTRLVGIGIRAYVIYMMVDGLKKLKKLDQLYLEKDAMIHENETLERREYEKLLRSDVLEENE